MPGEKKLDMVPVECVIRNRAAGSLVKRTGIEEGIELTPPLFDLFLKKTTPCTTRWSTNPTVRRSAG